MNGYPKAWEKFQSFSPTLDPNYLGFLSDIGAINRFAARFRLASSFAGISWNGYAATTAAGYNALFRLLLVWSAFEQYLKLVKLSQKDCTSLFDIHDLRSHARRIIDDAPRAYFRFLHKRVNASTKSALEDCFHGRSDNLSYLASAIRHIFVHGELTPNADGASPEDVASVCNQVSDFLLTLIDRDFERHVVEFENFIEVSLADGEWS